MYIYRMKRLTAILLWTICSFPLFLLAKDANPTLLVYGAGIEAFVAAVQGARSNVPTLWVVNDDPSFEDYTQSRISIASNHHLNSGSWLQPLTQVGGVTKPSASVAVTGKKDLNVRLLLSAMEKIIQQERNLTIVKNADI